MKTTGAQPASSRIILNFHGIGTPHAGLDASEAPYWCRHDIFVAIIDIVAGAIVREGASVSITFDDGNRSDLDIAAPVLRKAGLTSMFLPVRDGWTIHATSHPLIWSHCEKWA